MANAIVKISKRAKQISRANKNKAWKDCISQASREYKAGKLGAVASTRQTGSSNTKRDKQRRAKPPGKRKSASGRVNYERRKNRSDKPNTMAGAKAMLKNWHKEMLQKALLKKELATTKREKKQWSQKAAHLKKELKKFD